MLALWHRENGDFDAARALLERSLAMREQLYGVDSFPTSRTLSQLGVLVNAAGDEDAARPLFERGLAIAEQVYGADHPALVDLLTNLAFLERQQNNPAAAQASSERAVAILEATFGPDHDRGAGQRSSSPVRHGVFSVSAGERRDRVSTGDGCECCEVSRQAFL